MNYIVYKGTKILRTGSCSASMMVMQAGPGEKVMEGKLRDGESDCTQKMQGDQVVDKTPAEIEADNPTPVPVPEEEKTKHVTNKEWDALVARVAALK